MVASQYEGYDFLVSIVNKYLPLGIVSNVHRGEFDKKKKVYELRLCFGRGGASDVREITRGRLRADKPLQGTVQPWVVQHILSPLSTNPMCLPGQQPEPSKHHRRKPKPSLRLTDRARILEMIVGIVDG